MNPSGCLSRQVSPSHPSSEAVLTLAKSLASSQNAATASRTANCPWRCIITASTARWVIFFLAYAYKWKCQFLATSHRDITLMPGYHCHKPVFRPKMAIFRRAGMREGGLPLPLAFHYLIFMILRACDLNLVMISLLASKCQDFKLRGL